MHKLTPCKFWMYADWLEDVWNRMIAGILFIFLLCGFEEQITYTWGLLEDNWAVFQSYTSGRYTCRHKQRGQMLLWRHRCRDTEGSDVKVLSYFLWSFWTSLSSSSFSLVIKLCRTGISNLIYCATWWNTDKRQAKQEKRQDVGVARCSARCSYSECLTVLHLSSLNVLSSHFCWVT